MNISEINERLEIVKRELPIKLANQAQHHFVQAWREQGYEGAAWKEVKRRIPGTPEYKYPKNKGLSRRTNPILVRSGALRRDANDSIRLETWDMIRLVSSLKYSSYVNEERPFMMDSPGLRAKQEKVIIQELNKAFPK